MYLTTTINSTNSDINIFARNTNNTSLFTTSIAKNDVVSIINKNLTIEDTEPNIVGENTTSPILKSPQTSFNGVQFSIARNNPNFGKTGSNQFLFTTDMGHVYNEEIISGIASMQILNQGTPWKHQFEKITYNRNFASSEQPVNSIDCIQGFLLGDSNYPSKYFFVKNYAYAFVYNPKVSLWRVYKSNLITDEYSSFDANFSEFMMNLPAGINTKYIEPFIIGEKLFIFTSTLKAYSCKILTDGTLDTNWDVTTITTSITQVDAPFTLTTGSRGYIYYFNHETKKIFAINFSTVTVNPNYNTMSISDVTTHYFSINTILTSLTWKRVIQIGTGVTYIIDGLNQLAKCIRYGASEVKIYKISNPITEKFNKVIDNYFIVTDAIFFICITGEIYKCNIDLHGEIDFDSIIELPDQTLTISNINNILITSNSIYCISHSINNDGNYLAKRFDFTGGTNDLVVQSYYAGTKIKNSTYYLNQVIKLETSGEIYFKFDKNIYSTLPVDYNTPYGLIFYNIETGVSYSFIKNKLEKLDKFTTLKDKDGAGLVKASIVLPAGYYTMKTYEQVFGDKLLSVLGTGSYNPLTGLFAVADIIFTSGAKLKEPDIIGDTLKLFIKTTINKSLTKLNVTLST
jgi:hypothetical protein